MITSTMDALVWLGPRKMELRREPAPTPEPGEVLVAVEAVGICGSELSGYLGQISLRTQIRLHAARLAAPQGDVDTLPSSSSPRAWPGAPQNAPEAQDRRSAA